MDQATLDGIAQRWSRRARSGEWAKTLDDPRSYVNTDNAYAKFETTLLRFLDRFGAPFSFLDLGCGSGDIWKSFYDRASEIVGIDIAPGMIEEAAKKGYASNLLVGNIHEIDQVLAPEDKFDIVFTRGVLVNHLGKEYFAEIMNNVAPHTRYVFMFDYLSKDWFTGDRFIPNKPFYTPQEMIDMIQSTEFKNGFVEFHDIVGREPIVIIRK